MSSRGQSRYNENYDSIILGAFKALEIKENREEAKMRDSEKLEIYRKVKTKQRLRKTPKFGSPAVRSRAGHISESATTILQLRKYQAGVQNERIATYTLDQIRVDFLYDSYIVYSPRSQVCEKKLRK